MSFLVLPVAGTGGQCPSQGCRTCRDSTTYQAILEEGRQDGVIEGQISEARRLLLMLGVNRFGEPDEATRVAFEAIGDVERLERMIQRIYETSAPPGTAC